MITRSTFLAAFLFPLLLLSGCASPPGAQREGWSFCLVSINIQLGGSRTDPIVSTRNELGPNATQTHTLPMAQDQAAGATGIPLPNVTK